MKKKSLKTQIIKALMGAGLSRPQSGRYAKNLCDTGSILNAVRTRYFAAIYKATKKTPNDLIDYKGGGDEV